MEGNRPLLRPVPAAWTLWGRALVFAAGAIAFTVIDVCLEALQNVQKYVGADHATVRLGEAGGVLTFGVEDNGRGYDPASTRRGSGLQNIEDRLDALGGSLTVVAAPGRGVRVEAALPALAPVRTS